MVSANLFLSSSAPPLENNGSIAFEKTISLQSPLRKLGLHCQFALQVDLAPADVYVVPVHLNSPAPGTEKRSKFEKWINAGSLHNLPFRFLSALPGVPSSPAVPSACPAETLQFCRPRLLHCAFVYREPPFQVSFFQLLFHCPEANRFA